MASALTTEPPQSQFNFSYSFKYVKTNQTDLFFPNTLPSQLPTSLLGEYLALLGTNELVYLVLISTELNVKYHNP